MGIFSPVVPTTGFTRPFKIGADGSAGQIVQTDGAGKLTFRDPPASGASLPWVDVAAFATGGDGSQGNPWTGWDTAITWSALTTYYFRTGYYAYVNSPNFAKNGIILRGSAGVFIQHTGRGIGFNITGGISTDPFVGEVQVENINLLGHYAACTGTIKVTAGSNAVVGTGTLFTTELQVGDAISIQAGTSNGETHIVTGITDNTHLTTDANWLNNNGNNEPFVRGTTTIGFQVADIENGYLRNCSVRDVATTALELQGDITCKVENFWCCTDNPTYHQFFHIKAKYPVVIDTLGGSAADTTTYLSNINIDYFQGVGVWVKPTTTGCKLEGIICEVATGPVVGIQIDGPGNTLMNAWCEGLSGGTDIQLTNGNSYSNTLINCNSTHSSSIGGIQNVIIGGTFSTLLNSGFKNVYIGTAVTVGSEVFTDTGTRTVKIAVTNGSFNSIPATFGMAIVGAGDDSGGTTPNAAQANIYAYNLSGNLAIANPTNPTAFQVMRYRFEAYGAGNWSITWPSQFRVANGVTLPVNTGPLGTIKYVTVVRDWSNTWWEAIQAN